MPAVQRAANSAGAPQSTMGRGAIIGPRPSLDVLPRLGPGPLGVMKNPKLSFRRSAALTDWQRTFSAPCEPRALQGLKALGLGKRHCRT